MSEKITEREQCWVWAGSVKIFSTILERITNPAHLITEEDQKDIPELLKHLDIALKNAKEKCPILTKG